MFQVIYKYSNLTWQNTLVFISLSKDSSFKLQDMVLQKGAGDYLVLSQFSGSAVSLFPRESSPGYSW